MEKVSSFGPRDCRKIQKLLDHFLAGELGVETNQEILAHLEICPRCRNEERTRLQTREDLQEAWKAQPVPSDLEDKIAGKLKSSTPFRTPVLRLAAGFLLAIFIWGVIMLMFPSLNENSGVALAVDHTREAIADHVNCSGSAIPPSVALPFEQVQGTLRNVLREIDGSYQLVGKRRCQVGDVRFTHYVFEGSGQRISLILERKNDGQRLDLIDAGSERVIQGTKVIFLQRDSVTLACLELPDYFAYLISEKFTPDETYQLVTQLLSSL